MWWQMKGKTCRVTSSLSQNVIHPRVIISQPFWGEVVGMVVQTAARNKNWRLLMHCLLTSSSRVHSLLILCTQRCTALHNLCSSCFEFCLAHPTLTLLSADHAQTTSDHVCTLHCSSYHCLAESWSCSKTALLYATSAHHTSKFAMIILPLLCWTLIMRSCTKVSRLWWF